MRGPNLWPDDVPAKVVEELVPVGVLVEGLVEVELPRRHVAEHTQGGHIHVALREAEDVHTHLQRGSIEDLFLACLPPESNFRKTMADPSAMPLSGQMLLYDMFATVEAV